MHVMKGFAAAAALLGAALLTQAAHAAFPEKPVRIVVPFPAGGAVDAVARVVANHLTQAWNSPVVVDNKARPGQLNYGSAGSGNLTHLAAEYFLAQTRTRATHVPYKGSAPAVTDFLGGQLDFMFDVVPTALPHVRSGKFKALAVTSAARSSALQEVPTLAELGWHGFNITSWWGLVAPSGTPPEVIQAINAEVNRGLQTPAVRDALHKLGADPLGGTPEQFSVHIRQELERWKRVVIQSGAKAE